MSPKSPTVKTTMLMKRITRRVMASFSLPWSVPKRGG